MSTMGNGSAMRIGHFNFVSLWKLTDWGMYNRRNEAILRALSMREDVERVLHVEHIHFKGIVLRLIHWARAADRFMRKAFRLHVLKALSPLPVAVDDLKKYSVFSVVIFYDGGNPLLRSLNLRFMNLQYRAINRFFSKSENPVVLIAYLTTGYLEEPISAIRHDLLLVDFEDDNAERFNDDEVRRQYHDIYRSLLPRCDWVFANAESTVRKYSSLTRAGEITLVPNAADINNFKENGNRRPLEESARKRAGYVGVLNFEVDWGLFEYLLRRFPDVDFILIGFAPPAQMTILGRLTGEHRNLSFLGERSYREIPAYLSCFDVLLAMKKNDHSIAGGESQKTYEYLATGKPIVTTSVPPADKYGNLMYVADDKNAFCEAFAKALGEDDALLRARRIETAARNSWDRRAAVIADRVEKLLER